MDSLAARLDDLERRMARMIQTGVIAEADYAAARVRVAVGARLSPWLPWVTRRAGGDVDWWAPEVGEQVEIRAPNGEMNEARVTPAFYSDAVPPPANDPAIRLIRFGNGTEIKHDRKANRLSIDTPDDVDLTAAGRLTAQIGGTAELTAQGAIRLATPVSVTVEAPQSTFIGAVTVRGLFTYLAGLAGSGGAGAAALIDGDIEATGDVKSGGISTQHHKHPGDSGGTTGEPQ